MTGVQTCALPICFPVTITWGYGWIFFGYEVNERTINYIIKYITKRDKDNPEFNGKIFTSKRIGIGYINKDTLRKHKYQDKFRNKSSTTNILQAKNMDRSRTRSPPDHKRGKTSKVLQQNLYRDWETIEQYREYVNAVKYWQSIKKYGQTRNAKPSES